jgi:hypothetical protein
MSRSVSFVYLDGREIVASSPRQVFEALREGESTAPEDLGRYLDLLYGRGALMFSISLEVGSPSAALDARCKQALASLIQHGWLRIKKAPPARRPRRVTPADEAVETVELRAIA